MRLGLSLSRKKVQWKCCIKPLIRVEHIRIILRAQSGSCYAAACVVLLAPEFSPLICVHVSACVHWECRVRNVVFDVVCIWDWDLVWVEAGSLRCVRSSRCKVCRPKRHQVPWLKIQMGLPLLPPSLPYPLLFSALCCPSPRIFPSSTAHFINW